MLQPGDKKALAIIGAVVVAMLVVVAGATALLVRGHEKPFPELSFQAGDSLTRVETPRWCTAKMDECRGAPLRPSADPAQKVEYPSETFDHPVPIGSKATLSVPGEIAGAPWSVIAQFATPKGVQTVQWLHLPDTMHTQVFESTPDRVLIGIEVQVISAARATVPGQPQANPDEADLLIRGIFSILTMPEGFRIPDETPLGAVSGD